MPSNKNKYLEMLTDLALEEDRLNTFESEFIDSIEDIIKADGFLSEAQGEKLEEIYKKYCEENNPFEYQ